MSKIVDQAYESIRGYVPEDVNRILSEQIPKIEQYIETEIDTFGEELSTYIDSQVASAVDDAKKDSDAVKKNMLSLITDIEADMSTNDLVLQNATKQLKAAVDSYEEQFLKLGKAVNTAVKTAVKATGLPLP